MYGMISSIMQLLPVNVRAQPRLIETYIDEPVLRFPLWNNDVQSAHIW